MVWKRNSWTVSGREDQRARIPSHLQVRGDACALVTGAAVLDNPEELQAPAWSGFAQNNWRLRSNLTLSAGLRYEYVAPADRDVSPPLTIAIACADAPLAATTDRQTANII